MIPDQIPLLADLEAEARRRGWNQDAAGQWWDHEERAARTSGPVTWFGPDGRHDATNPLDAALTAWATADAVRLGWVRAANDAWNAPESYGHNNVNCVQDDLWWPPGRPDARNDAPDEPTAVRRALDAWLRAREAVPAPAEADRPSSGELPADLVARAKAAGLERGRNPETDRPRWYLVAADYDRLCCWEAGDADGWYWTRRSDSGGILVASEADALRAWLDSREGAGRPAPRSGYAEAEQLRAERDAATQEADRLRTRLVDAEAERDGWRRELAALDRALGLAGEGRTRYHGDRVARIEKLTATAADAAEELHAYRDAASVIEELTGDASPGSLRGLLGDLETGCQWLEDAGICTEGTPYPDVMRAAAEEITALRGRLIGLRREMARGAA